MSLLYVLPGWLQERGYSQLQTNYDIQTGLAKVIDDKTVH